MVSIDTFIDKSQEKLEVTYIKYRSQNFFSCIILCTTSNASIQSNEDTIKVKQS